MTAMCPNCIAEHLVSVCYSIKTDGSLEKVYLCVECGCDRSTEIYEHEA